MCILKRLDKLLPTFQKAKAVYTYINKYVIMKVKIYLFSLFAFLGSYNTSACDGYLDFCSAGTLVNNEKIVVGTIANSSTNSVQLNIIDVLFGVENNTAVTIWDGSTIECNGPWPNDANDMGNVGDTVLCMIEPITIVENPWDIIGDYRRPSLLFGETFTNFSGGGLFENTYNYNEVLTFDFANHCCNSLSQNFYITFDGLPVSTGSNSPITLTGYPQGGTFSGTGIVFNAFNPSIAGPGNHTITYTINDEFGCSFSTQKDILVFTINYNFVNYNLGIVSPKIVNQISLQMEVAEADEYSFKIFDLIGKQVYNETQNFEAGIHLKNISLEQNLPKGVYLFNLSNSNTNVTRRFIVGN